MPATTERPRHVPIPTLIDDAVPSRKRSPPPCPKLPDSRSAPSPPPSAPSPSKSPVSPRTEKRPTPRSTSPDPEPKKLDKPDSKPDSPSAKKPGIKPDPEPASRSEQDSASADPKEASSGKGIIDMDVLNQIRELDDDGDDEFSREMVYAFFLQAEETFSRMDDTFRKGDLEQLSSLGHFLKGSSAALGVSKVQSSCEKIQHYGNLRDEEAGVALDEKEALSRIEILLRRVQKEYRIAEEYLKSLYPQSH